jgi:sporulation protein YlmC with PRC-barrel domain
MSMLRWTSALVVLIVAGAAVAGEMTGSKAAVTEKPTITTLAAVHPLQRATHVVGMIVRNADHTLRGEVTDIVLNTDRTHVESLIVRYAGLTDRLLPLTFAGIRCTADGREFVCDLKREDVNLASGFAANDWPADLKMRRVTPLLSMDVRDNAGTSVAKLRDLLIDTSDARVTEATVSIGGVMGIGGKLASVAWSSVKLAENGSFAEILVGASTLKGLAYREKEYWQHLGFGGKDLEPVRDEPVRERGYQPGLYYGY